MTPHTAILSGPTSPRASSDSGRPVVLIRVPALRPSRATRPAAPRGRRRLRREVRIAASTLLFALPMSWALLTFPKIGTSPDATATATPPARTQPRPIAPPAPEGDDDPRVTIGLTLAPMAPATIPSPPDSEAPVVAPAGYLVPDDHPEEASHEDVDRALARAYGTAARPGPAAPGPHFAIETPAESAAPGRPPAVSLAWPETVLALERSHGPRFEALADALLAARDERDIKVLLFTSPHRAEGRTTLVLALARALARRPGRTLLVDGDLGGPMLARSLGLRPGLGLEDVLERRASLASAAIHAPDDHLALLPVVAPPGRPREVVASAEWSRLMADARREYDMVLIDGGPIFTGPSAATVPRSVDAAVLVHNKPRTTDRALLRARDALEAADVPLLGLAETFC